MHSTCLPACWIVQSRRLISSLHAIPYTVPVHISVDAEVHRVMACPRRLCSSINIAALSTTSEMAVHLYVASLAVCCAMAVSKSLCTQLGMGIILGIISVRILFLNTSVVCLQFKGACCLHHSLIALRYITSRLRIAITEVPNMCKLS